MTAFTPETATDRPKSSLDVPSLAVIMLTWLQLEAVHEKTYAPPW
jgi:hypothetical protein